MKLNYLRLMPGKDFQVWTIFQWLATVTGQKLEPLWLNKTVLVTPELWPLDQVSAANTAWPLDTNVCIAQEYIALVTGETLCEDIRHEE